MRENIMGTRRRFSSFSGKAFLALTCALAAVSCASAPPPQEPVPGTAYFERAMDAAGKGRHLAAIDQYARYINLHKNEPQYAVPALSNRGTAYWALGRHREAIADFDLAAQMAPDNPQTYINRGNVYADMGDLERAIADYSRAIELDGKNGLAFSNRGLAWSSLKRFDMAIPDLDRAIELGHEGLYTSLMKRGVIRFGVKDYEGAEEDFSQVVALRPGDAEAYYFRGLTLRQLNEPQKAQKDFQQAAALQKETPKQ